MESEGSIYPDEISSDVGEDIQSGHSINFAEVGESPANQPQDAIPSFSSSAFPHLPVPPNSRPFITLPNGNFQWFGAIL